MQVVCAQNCIDLPVVAAERLLDLAERDVVGKALGNLHLRLLAREHGSLRRLARACSNLTRLHGAARPGSRRIFDTDSHILNERLRFGSLCDSQLPYSLSLLQQNLGLLTLKVPQTF